MKNKMPICFGIILSFILLGYEPNSKPNNTDNEIEENNKEV